MKGDPSKNFTAVVLSIIARDYRAMPALDRYDNRDIDDDVEEENFEDREDARLRAERAMDRADGRRRARLPGALLEGQPSQGEQVHIWHLCMPICPGLHAVIG